MLCCDDIYDACTDDTYDVCTASIDDSPISKSDRYSSRQILLDTGAGQSVFKDKNLFYSLRKSDSLVIDGVNNNSDPLVITEYGTTDFGIVYYSKDCVANILSFGNLVDDSDFIKYCYKSDIYIVQMTEFGQYYNFSRDLASNIYICDRDTMVYSNYSINVVTVSTNKNKYTARQIKQAELAREYQRKLGYTSSGQLIKMIGEGSLGRCDIVAQDVLRAIDIFGPDLGSLKGKTTSHKAQLQEEIPIIASVQEHQTMYIDLMFVNSLPNLISVVNPLEYVMVHKLAKKDQHTLWTSLSSQLGHISKYGFKIDMIRVDGESAINTEWFHSRVGTLGMILDTTGAGEAVAVIERKIRTVKERIRAVANMLPYNLTERLESWLVRYVVSRIVLLPTRNSIAYTSPRERIFGRKISVGKELKHGFGDYVQVHTDAVDNSMKPRTSGAIALMSTGNLEGSWYYMLSGDLKIVNRTKATSLPMTYQIIEYLNQLASNRKSKTVIDTYSFDKEPSNELDDDIDVRLSDMIVPIAHDDSEHVE